MKGKPPWRLRKGREGRRRDVKSKQGWKGSFWGKARAKITWKRLSNRRPTKGLDRAPHSKANSSPSWNDRDLEVFKTGLVSFAARRQGRMEPWAWFSRFLLPAFNLIFTLLGCQVSKPGSYRKSLAPSSASLIHGRGKVFFVVTNT